MDLRWARWRKPPASTGHTTKDLLVLLAQIRMELRQSHADTPGVGPSNSNHGEGNWEAGSILAGRSLLATVEADTVFRFSCFWTVFGLLPLVLAWTVFGLMPPVLFMDAVSACSGLCGACFSLKAWTLLRKYVTFAVVWFGCWRYDNGSLAKEQVWASLGRKS